MVRRRWSPWRAGALALAWAALPVCARAGEPAPADDDLPMIGESTVVGDRPRTRVARDPTASATVVRADEYAGEVKGVAELVATAPGVAVDGYGGLGQFATASIRGSTASGVLVLLDGIPLQTSFGGGVDLASIPRSWIERIEIVRGVEGAHYGAGSLGGVVNVVTARPRDGRWSAEATAGSFGSLAGSADGARRVGPATILLSATGERVRGDFPYLWQPTPTAPTTPLAATRDHNGAWRAGGMAKAVTPVGGGTLDAVALVSAGRRELPGWPWALTPDDWQEDGRALLASRYGTPVGALRIEALLAARLEWLEARYGSLHARERFAAAGLTVEGSLPHRRGALRVELGAQEEGARALGLEETQTRPRLHAALSEELRLAGERLRVAPAIRLERDGPFTGVSGKVGSAWSIAGPLALRASAGRTFRAPTIAELHVQQGLAEPNPDLAPEVGMGGDAALVLERGPLLASVGAHATLYRDLVYYQRVSMGRLKPFNAGKALVRGLEAELAAADLLPPVRVALSASYTLLDTEILRGVAETLGNEVPHRARHRLFARAAAAPGPAEAHVELHWVGRQWADDRNLREIPAALVWNAGAAVTALRDPALRLAIEVRNLLDDRELQDGYGNPLPGRTLWITVSASSTPTKGVP